MSEVQLIQLFRLSGDFERAGKSMNSVVMICDDETKLFRVLKTRTDCAELQRALV